MGRDGFVSELKVLIKDMGSAPAVADLPARGEALLPLLTRRIIPGISRSDEWETVSQSQGASEQQLVMAVLELIDKRQAISREALEGGLSGSHSIEGGQRWWTAREEA